MIWSKPLILLLLLLLIALKEEIKFRRAAQEKYESFWDDAGVMANLKMHDMSDKLPAALQDSVVEANVE